VAGDARTVDVVGDDWDSGDVRDGICGQSAFGRTARVALTSQATRKKT